MQKLETNTHQDHVIAHVMGTTILGSFVLDETLYLLLDIGFIWNIYLNFEMGLLPHPVAISELDIDEAVRTELRQDVDSLMSPGPWRLHRIDPSILLSPIQDVELFDWDGTLRMEIKGADEDDFVRVISDMNQRTILVES